MEWANANGSPDYDKTYGVDPLPNNPTPSDMFIQSTQRDRAGLNSSGTGYKKEKLEEAPKGPVADNLTIQPKIQEFDIYAPPMGKDTRSNLQKKVETFANDSPFFGSIALGGYHILSETGEAFGDFVYGDMSTSLKAAPDVVLTVAGGMEVKALFTAKSELTVYRVFGGDSRAQGFSWTTTTPTSVRKF